MVVVGENTYVDHDPFRLGKYLAIYSLHDDLLLREVCPEHCEVSVIYIAAADRLNAGQLPGDFELLGNFNEVHIAMLLFGRIQFSRKQE